MPAVLHPNRIRSRRRANRRLMVAAVLVQTVALSAAWWLTFQAVRHKTAERIQDVLLASSHQTLDRMAQRIESVVTTDPEVGSQAWERLQTLVEDVRLPGDGFVCVLDPDNRILCHPDLRRRPGLLGMDLGDVAVQPAQGDQAPVRISRLQGSEIVGRATLGPGNTHYIASRVIPSFGGRLVVHQPESGLLRAEELVTSATFRWAVALGLAVPLCTAALTFVIIRRQTSTLETVNASLESEVASRIEQTMAARNALIFGLAKLADHRDSDTGRHLDRICAYSRLLATALKGVRPEVDDAWIERLTVAASMHDIGKVGIPDRVLLKPGSLTRDEYEVMKRHTLIGADTLIAIRECLGEDDLIRMGIEVALSHHERWDGTGYPFGLSGEQIPLPGRIVAIADVYDALTSERVYKKAMPHAKAVEIILAERGRQFDPLLVDIFERLSADFDAVRRRLCPDEIEMRALRERYEAA